MQHEEFMKLCARKVAEYENRRDDVDVEIDRDDVFVYGRVKPCKIANA